jgi:preprotein translocase subunit SecG
MIESNTPLTLILIINSLILIGLILNQNDSSKDFQNAKSSINPFEKATWASLVFQLSLLLIKIKTFDF